MVPPGDGTGTLNLPLIRTPKLKPVLQALQNEGHEIFDILDGHRINEAQLHDAKAFITRDAVYAINQEAAARTQPDLYSRVGRHWTGSSSFLSTTNSRGQQSRSVIS